MNKLLSFITLAATLTACNTKEPEKLNVLFIAVDDLRPELNCYGNSHIHSPNIDKLANSGSMFSRAYCNIPVCGASRASLLSGMHPTRKRFTTWFTRTDEDAPAVVTLPEHFKTNGYTTISYGKVFHHPDDGLQSWSETPWRPDYPNDINIQELSRDYQDSDNLWTRDSLLPGGAAGPAWEKSDVPDNTYFDGLIADKALERLNMLQNSDAPFFLAVGFVKPHLPFNAPSKYWDMYTREEIQLAPNPYMPENAPKEAIYNFGELRAYSNIPKDEKPLEDSLAYNLKHGYYACVSYTDAQIGKLLDKLEETGLAKNTIVVIWGDHGWSLGEHTHWCKHTCFHNSLQVPMIVRAPGIKPSKPLGLTDFIDIFPSLCELADLKIPEQLQGNSFVDKMKDPKLNQDTVYCRYPNGETIVTERYVYTEYHSEAGIYLSNMLYDHQTDPFENVNIAGKPEMQGIKDSLSTALRKHIEKVN